MADTKLKNQLNGLFSGFGGDTDSAPKPTKEKQSPKTAKNKPKTKAKKSTAKSTKRTSPSTFSIEMETVTAMSELTATVFDPNELLTQMASLICKNFNLASVNIYFLDKDQDDRTLILSASSDEISDLSRNTIFIEGNQSLLAKVANENKGNYNNNITTAESKPTTARAELAVPMTIVEHVIGVLDVLAFEPNFFDDGYLKIFATLAAQIVVASQNIRLLRNSEDQARRLMLLNEMGTSLNVTATLDQSLQVATRYISHIMSSDQISIALQIDHRLGWVQLYTFNEETAILDSSQAVPLAETAIAEVIASQEILNLSNINYDRYVDCQSLTAAGFSNTLIVPLVAGKQSLGTLSISSKLLDVYSTSDEEMLLHIASLLTSTIRNRRLFNQIQNSFTETEILYETSADINTAQSYDEILEALYHYTRLGEDPVNVTLYFFDRPKTDAQLPKNVFALSSITESVNVALPVYFKFELFESIISEFKSDDPFVLHNLNHNGLLHPNLQHLYADQLGASDLIFVPLRVGKQIVGFLTAAYAHALNFKETDIRRLSSLVGQAAVATQNIYNLTLSEQQTRELTAVNTVLKEISRQLDVQHILETVYREIQNIVPVEAFYIALLDDKNEHFTFPLAFDEGEALELPDVPTSNHPDMRKVLETRETLFITRTPEELERLQATRELSTVKKGMPAVTLLFVPLLVGKQLLGVMSVQSYHRNVYGERDIQLMNSMANHLAVAIQNARLYRQAQARAQREAALREVTTHIRNATDVDSVMRVTVQQLSQVLGRRAFIHLREEKLETDIKN